MGIILLCIPINDTFMAQPPSAPAPHPNIRRIMILALFAVVIGSFFAFDLKTYFTFDYLRENEAALRAFVADAPLLAGATYLLIYVTVVAFSLPGALILSLSGGLIFGIPFGGFLAVSGATLGAILLFVTARFVLGDYLRARFKGRLVAFEAAFNENAASYLLTLRLIPLFPFFIVNLGAALLGVRFITFVLTTFFGILPASFVFVSIGNGISALLRAGGTPNLSIVSRPEIILPLLGLAVLSLLPVLYKRIKGGATGG